MTIFAGVFARRSDCSIPDELASMLRSSVSRYPGDSDRHQILTDSGIYIVKIDIGALGEPGDFAEGHTTGFVAGDPILQNTPNTIPMSRMESLRIIAHDVAMGKLDSLYSCRGTYCAVVYEQDSHRLHLMTDKLGVRPIYVWILPDYIIFATALRILEEISFYEKVMDLQGVAETACFGYPLSDRTPYKDIYSLHAGEVWHCNRDEFRRHRYWRWNEVRLQKGTKAISDRLFAEQLYQVFIDAVRIRLRGQETTAALLSGGLDSRAIIAALKVLGANISAASLSVPNSQDYFFSQMVAEKLEIHFSQLHFRPLVEGDPYGKAAVRDWLSSTGFLAPNSGQSSGVVWSGDGGSVGLGHTYLNANIVDAARNGDLHKATMLFMAYNRWDVQPKLLKKKFSIIFNDLIMEGIKTELESLPLADPGRIFYLFLLLNDQRRHMFNHFENMDLTRLEFEMPFYDAAFISEVMQRPIDSFLYHNFYLEWLKCFPSELGILEIPWQAYPGHVPCPLPQPEGLIYQWNRVASPERVKKKRVATLKKARGLLHESRFSKKYLRYEYMYLFMLLTRLGRADRSYLLHVPSVLYRYWSRSH